MMSNNENEIIRLKKLTEDLISLYKKKISFIYELKAKNEQLETENKYFKQKIKELEEKTEILKTAKTISLSDKDKATVKQKINRLLREIDISIGLLNE